MEIHIAKSTELAREKGYTIYRMSFQILDGLEMTGLYFKMDGDEKSLSFWFSTGDSALDTRIRSAVSCGFFNVRDKYPWNDWTWFGSAAKFDDAELAAMVYPRSLCIEIGKDDPIFDVKYGERSYERLLEICKAVGTEWLSFIPFDGAHEFCTDDAPIEALVRRIKG